MTSLVRRAGLPARTGDLVRSRGYLAKVVGDRESSGLFGGERRRLGRGDVRRLRGGVQVGEC